MTDSALKASASMMDRAYAVGRCSVDGCDEPRAGEQTQTNLSTMGYAGTKRCEKHVLSGLRVLMGGKGE